MEKKLQRLKELIALKEKTDAEIRELLGETTERPKRTWTRREKPEVLHSE